MHMQEGWRAEDGLKAKLQRIQRLHASVEFGIDELADGR